MRWAICNEIFEDRPLAEAFTLAARIGYEALEIAPYTLGAEPLALSSIQRRAVRDGAIDTGLGITGMHWLLARTEGMHVSSAEPGVADRTLAYLRELAHLCAELGGTVLVFGSPQQRSTPSGMSRLDAIARATDLFSRWAATAGELGVTICLEALPAVETDLMTTTAEVLSIVEAIALPAVQLVLDVKSMSSETTPIPELIRLAAPHLAYFQANDANRGGPGFGETDFAPIFAALAEVGYCGDVSVEAFDFAPGREAVAVGSIAYLRREAARSGWRAGS
jgi:sugar phosphate isomerase/epimerase